MTDQAVRVAAPRKADAGAVPRLAIAFLFAIITPIVFSVGPLILNPTRAFLLLTIVPLTIGLLQGRFGRIMWVDVLMFGHALWQLLAIAVNNPDQVVQFGGSSVLEFLGGYLIGRATIRSPQDFKIMARAVFLVILVLIPFAMIETQTGHPPISQFLSRLGLRAAPDVISSPRLGLDRAQSVFQHPIHYGLFCSMFLSTFFVGLRTDLSRKMRLLGATVIFTGVILSVSSGAVLPFIMQAALIAWAAMTRNVKGRWLILMLILTPVYLLLEVLSDRPAHIAILTSITFNSHNVYWRTFAFEWGMVNIWANPIFGLGLRDWVRPAFMLSSSVDNFWLLNTMRFGIPALILLVAGVIVALWRIGRRPFSIGSDIYYIRLAWMFTMISMISTLATVHVWGPLYSFVLMVFSSGLWMINYEEPTDQDETEAHKDPRQNRMTYSRFDPDHARDPANAPERPIKTRAGRGE